MKIMSLLDEILDFNDKFVENKTFEQYETSGIPKRKMAILSCMDTRLLELLPKSMNLKNGDAKMIKNAGAIITHPFDSVMRSLLVAIYELQVGEVFIIAHHECGMSGVNTESMMEKMKQRGIGEEVLATLDFSGVDLHKWLKGFTDVKENVRNSVEMAKKHPLFPKDVPVHGLVIHPKTGKLDLIVNGYEK
jgi:carbonic anhydrase